MSISSNYQKGLFIDASLRTAQVYLALFTNDPGLGSGFANECQYSGYQRKSMGTPANAAWTAVDGNGQTQNGNTVMFDPKGDGGTVTVTHFAICDSSNGGNKLFVGPLDAAKTLAQNDVIGILGGGLVFQF